MATDYWGKLKCEVCGQQSWERYSCPGSDLQYQIGADGQLSARTVSPVEMWVCKTPDCGNMKRRRLSG